MTDPQDDVPCRGCETEGPPTRLDDDGLCRRCCVPREREADADLRRLIIASAYDGGLHRLPTEVPDAR